MLLTAPLKAAHRTIEFDEPERDTDTVEILSPLGYSVDELPPATNIDDGFASYHSKIEFSGRTLKYTRTLEIKELSVRASKAEQLKAFYRDIAGDERNSAVSSELAASWQMARCRTSPSVHVAPCYAC